MPNISHNLERFVEAQENTYQSVISELSNGKKLTHWMWYIFPQIEGLASTSSNTATYYSVKSINEAIYYLKHPILGNRLIECAEITLSISNNSASEVFGYPDYLKLKSSMTLFDYVSNDLLIFNKVLTKYFDAEKDMKTTEILKRIK